ncbi:ATP-binding cassette transporter yor1 [Metarhizium acridum]|nr:ATP-binding cassette transporter yor1 [Metarhizium acridum]
MQIFQAFGVSHFIYRGMMMGGQSRGVLIGFIYEKAMVISGRAKAGGVKPSIMPESDDADEVEKGKETATDEQSAGKKKKKTKTKKGKPQQDGLGWANGRIVNLMSVDTYRIDQASALFHMIWTSPVVCLITLVLLLVNLTYSALAGFALLVVGVPALTKAIQTLFRRRKAINKITDQRVSLTQEILQSVRFVKYFGWEKAFIARLGEFRAKEIYSIQVLLAIRNAINAVSMSLPIFASMLSFIVYSLSNHDLAPAEVFSSLALFNGLRIPLNLLPLVLGQVTDAWSSMKRIEEFLMQEEQEEDVVYKPEGSNAVEMIDAAFTWERTATQDPDKATIAGAGKEKRGVKDGAKESTSTPKPAKSQSSAGNSEEDSGSTLVEEREPFKLQGLNFQISRNELVAVIGTVGSGKSSLLAALAGDMRKTNGDVVYGASRAFCPQYAWIQNTTLQNNITFGKDMDRDWYREVVRACALQADLDMLPNGDQTEIGERGITISGGQKQRLNIARAIYFNADIVIMDDPLSAVDAHVGRHIFDNAILGLLKDKCRILATHQLWVLSRCDRIIWMDGGKIQAIDTFDNLMRDHRGFQSLMETTAVEEKEEEPRPRAPVDLADERKKRKQNKKGAALMQQEEKPESSVPWSVYAAYVRASGSILNAPLVITILIISQGANIVTGLWLSWWTSDKFGYSTGKYIGIYAALGVVQALLMFAFSVTLTVLGTKSSKVMLREAVQRVLRAPMSFFDTTPLGRITNRFFPRRGCHGQQPDGCHPHVLLHPRHGDGCLCPYNRLLPLVCHCPGPALLPLYPVGVLLQGISPRSKALRVRAAVQRLCQIRRGPQRGSVHQGVRPQDALHQRPPVLHRRNEQRLLPHLFQPEVAIRAARHGGQRARLHRGHPGRDVAVQRQPLHRRPRAQLHPVHCAAAAVLHPAAGRGGKRHERRRAAAALRHAARGGGAAAHGRRAQHLAGEGRDCLPRRRDAVPPGPAARPAGAEHARPRRGARRHRGPHRRRQELHHVDAVPARRDLGRHHHHRRRQHLHRGPVRPALAPGHHPAGPDALPRHRPQQPRPLQRARRPGAVVCPAASPPHTTRRVPRRPQGGPLPVPHPPRLRRRGGRAQLLPRPAPAHGPRARPRPRLPNHRLRRGHLVRRHGDRRQDPKHNGHRLQGQDPPLHCPPPAHHHRLRPHLRHGRRPHRRDGHPPRPLAPSRHL